MMENQVSNLDEEYAVTLLGLYRTVTRLKSESNQSRSHRFVGDVLIQLKALSPEIDVSEVNAPNSTKSRYKNLREIAEGGFGKVFKAYDERIRRDVAVKFLSSKYRSNDREIERFFYEPIITAQIGSIGIPPVFDSGEWRDEGPVPAGTPFFTEQLLDWENHETELQRIRDTKDYLRFLEAVCSHIADAHHKKIIHRDISLKNILIERNLVRVIDWGLSVQLTENDQVDDPEKPGTPDYMAPESAKLGIYDFRSDVYSLGILIAVIVLKELPRNSVREVDCRKTVRDLYKQEDPKFVKIIASCLETESDKRPANAIRLLEEVETYRQSLHDRAIKLSLELERARHRRNVAIVVLSAFAILFCGVLYWWNEYNTRLQAKTSRMEAFRKELSWLLSDARQSVLKNDKWETVIAFARSADNFDDLQGSTLVKRLIEDVKAEYALAEKDRQLIDEITDIRLSRAEETHSFGTLPTSGEMQGSKNKWDTVIPFARSADGFDDLHGSILAQRLLDDVKAEYALAETISGKGPEIRATFDRYVSAFRNFGVDIHSPLFVEGRYSQISSRPEVVQRHIVSALDDWAVTSREEHVPTEKIQSIFQLASLICTNPKLDAIREVLSMASAGERSAAITKLLASQDWDQCAPDELFLVVHLLTAGQEYGRAAKLLRTQQVKDPSDAWVNFSLGQILFEHFPEDREESVIFFNAARAIEPKFGHALAHVYEELGRSDKALDLFDVLRKGDPENPRHCACHAKSLRRLGRTDEANEADLTALRISSQLISRYPKSWQFYVHKGLAQLGLERNEEAITSFKEAIELNPTSFSALQNLGLAYRLIGDTINSEQAYLKAIQLKPNSGSVRSQLGVSLAIGGRLDDGLAIAAEAIGVEPQLASVWADYGFVLQANGKQRESQAAYFEALKIQADDPVVNYNYGIGCQKLGDLDGCITHLKKAVDLNPAFGVAWMYLGMAQMDSDAEAGIKAFQAAIKLEPEALIVHRNFGISLNAIGRHEEAIAVLQSALAINSQDRESVVVISLAKMGLGDYENAIAELRKYEKPDAKVLAQIAWNLFILEDFDGAIGEYESALNLDPNSLDALEGLGDVYKEIADGSNEYQLAVDSYLKAEAIFSDSETVSSSLAECYLALEKYDLAERYIRKSISIDPDFEWAHYILGEILFETNRLSEASDAYQNAIKISPDFLEAYIGLSIVKMFGGDFAAANEAANAGLAVKPDDLFLRSCALGSNIMNGRFYRIMEIHALLVDVGLALLKPTE